jgi:two-component system, OmpR family, sensor histidine kinase KdpD
MRPIWKFLASERYVIPFLLSVLIAVIVTALLLVIRDNLETATVALIYLLSVGASAALWGLWPSIVAALAAFFSLNYFFPPPYGTLMVHQSQDILAPIIFLVLATIIEFARGTEHGSYCSAFSHLPYRSSKEQF